jgi:hypothetical protein
MAAFWIQFTDYLHTQDASLHPLRHPCVLPVLADGAYPYELPCLLITIGRDDGLARRAEADKNMINYYYFSGRY